MLPVLANTRILRVQSVYISLKIVSFRKIIDSLYARFCLYINEISTEIYRLRKRQLDYTIGALECEHWSYYRMAFTL